MGMMVKIGTESFEIKSWQWLSFRDRINHPWQVLRSGGGGLSAPVLQRWPQNGIIGQSLTFLPFGYTSRSIFCSCVADPANIEGLGKGGGVVHSKFEQWFGHNFAICSYIVGDIAQGCP